MHLKLETFPSISFRVYKLLFLSHESSFMKTQNIIRETPHIVLKIRKKLL